MMDEVYIVEYDAKEDGSYLWLIGVFKTLERAKRAAAEHENTELSWEFREDMLGDLNVKWWEAEGRIHKIWIRLEPIED